MPSAHIVRVAQIADSFRVQQVGGMFDIPNRQNVPMEWDVSLPIEEKDWNIGLIIGASGSGKSVIASEIFKDAYLHASFDWPADKSVLDGFPADLDAKSITGALSSVGFSSPPHWLKSWHVLSNGMKFRAELARVLLLKEETVIFDEFTSVVDRDVAKICCAAVAKTIRRRLRPRLVAISCHFDILDWLQPDWVFDVNKNRFEWRRLRRRPEVRLEIQEESPAAWPLSRGHHYLSADMHRAAKVFVAYWLGRPVALTSYLHFPHASTARFKREHRTVVLPDFQGIGIGNALSEWLGGKLTSEGWRFISTTSHPAMIRHRMTSPLWRVNRSLGHAAPSKGPNSRYSGSSAARISVGFEFIRQGQKTVETTDTKLAGAENKSEINHK